MLLFDIVLSQRSYTQIRSLHLYAFPSTLQEIADGESPRPQTAAVSCNRGEEARGEYNNTVACHMPAACHVFERG